MLYYRTHNIRNQKDTEINIPDRYVLGEWCTYDEWEDFNKIYERICDLRNFYLLCSESLNTSVSQQQVDKDEESVVELKICGYEYLLTMLDNKVIYESLVKDRELIALRTDNSSVALNEERITESEFRIYDALKDSYSNPSILTALGKGLRDKIKGIICFPEREDYMSSGDLGVEYLGLTKEYGVNPLVIVNKYLPFIEDDLQLTEKLELSYGENIKLPFELGSSGIKRFCRLIPYLEAARENDLIIVISIFDYHFHPLVARALLSEYIGPDFKIITRVKNVPSEFVSNPYICKNETNVENTK